MSVVRKREIASGLRTCLKAGILWRVWIDSKWIASLKWFTYCTQVTHRWWCHVLIYWWSINRVFTEIVIPRLEDFVLTLKRSMESKQAKWWDGKTKHYEITWNEVRMINDMKQGWLKVPVKIEQIRQINHHITVHQILWISRHIAYNTLLQLASNSESSKDYQLYSAIETCIS